MKKRRMQDEREVGLNNQIGREAYGLVALLLIGAVCVKTYGMGLPVSSSLVELGVLLVSILYLIIRGVFLGNPLVDDSRRGRRWMALAALALSLVVAAGNGLQNYADHGAQYTGLLDPHLLAAMAISFLSSLVLISAALFLLCWCHRRGQHRLERNLEEREP